MTFAIVHKDNRTKCTRGDDGELNLFGRREVAERIAARMGDSFIVVPW